MKYAAEQISKWHPDKYADAVSDAILDAILKKDKNAQCGIEVMVKDETVVVGGEVSTSKSVSELDDIIRSAVFNTATNLDYRVERFINLVGKQSPQINHAVLSQEDLGAGDQGIVTGYANILEFPYFDSTSSEGRLNPYIAKLLADDVMDAFTKVVEKSKRNFDSIFVGDAKCQVIYDDRSKKIVEIIMSACHRDDVSLEDAQEKMKDIITEVIYKYNELFPELILEDLILTLNPAGKWTIGGPTGDAGITGRKLVADAYGPYVPIGGGAHHGKNYTKVDRSGALVARIIALDMFRFLREMFPYMIDPDNTKDIIKDIKVEISYVIGVSQPSSINVVTGDSFVNRTLLEIIKNEYDLTPRGLIEILDDYNGYNTIKDISRAYMLKHFG